MRISRVLLHVTRVTCHAPGATWHVSQNLSILGSQQYSSDVFQRNGKKAVWFIFEYKFEIVSCKKLVWSNDVYSVKLTRRPHIGRCTLHRAATPHQTPGGPGMSAETREHHYKEEKLIWWEIWDGRMYCVVSILMLDTQQPSKFCVLWLIINPVKSSAKVLHLFHY